MSYIQTSSVNFYFEQYGEGTPMLLLHGFSPDHRLMKGFMEPVFGHEDAYRRVYIDLPGMGKTKSYHNIVSANDILDALLEFISIVFKNEKFTLVGESFGGYLTRGIISKIPDQILGAAFVCPVIEPVHSKRILPNHRVLREDEDFTKTLSQVDYEDFSRNNVVLTEYTWKRYQQEIVVGIQVADKSQLEKIQQNYAFSFPIDQQQFDKPCLFVLGRQDSVVGYKDALKLVDVYSRANFSVIDTAGHNLQIEQPKILNELAKDWLYKLKV